jgi:hypothetical protein
MRQRVGRDVPAVPPLEMTSYEAWCAGRGLAPFGVGGDVVSLRAAHTRWRMWCDEREAWAEAHDISEDDPVLDWHGSTPFDPDI